jgi:hypothetical protein
MAARQGRGYGIAGLKGTTAAVPVIAAAILTARPSGLLANSRPRDRWLLAAPASV